MNYEAIAVYRHVFADILNGYRIIYLVVQVLDSGGLSGGFLAWGFLSGGFLS